MRRGRGKGQSSVSCADSSFGKGAFLLALRGGAGLWYTGLCEILSFCLGGFLMARKRFVCLLLVVVLLLTLVPLASGSVYFTMVNSQAPDALWAGTMPVVRNGNIYVPQSVLSRFGVSSSREGEELTLSSGSVYIRFDLEAGTNVTQDGGSLSVAPMARHGTWFFPVGTTGGARGPLASFFGFQFRVVQTEPAPTVRLYTSVGNISHAALVSEGEILFGLQARYDTFMGRIAGGETGGATVGDPVAPSPTPGPVSLNFVGLSAETGVLLDALGRSRISAGFFVTAADVLEHPDFVRRLHGEGHQIGVFLTGDVTEAYRAASAALFEVARVRTVVVAVESRDMVPDVLEAGLVLFYPQVRPMPSGAALENLAGNLLIRDSGNAHALSALPGAVRSNAQRVVSVVSLLS